MGGWLGVWLCYLKIRLSQPQSWSWSWVELSWAWAWVLKYPRINLRNYCPGWVGGRVGGLVGCLVGGWGVAGESGIKANLSLRLSWSCVELSWGWAWQYLYISVSNSARLQSLTEEKTHPCVVNSHVTFQFLKFHNLKACIIHILKIVLVCKDTAVSRWMTLLYICVKGIFNPVRWHYTF